MQGMDVTTLQAVLHDLRSSWIPARIEGARQDNPHTVRLILRNIQTQVGLDLSCHPVAARMHLSTQKIRGKAVSRYPFAQQLFQHLGGQVLVNVDQPAWERVAILEFALRPQAPIAYRLYVEIMGKYSNLILTDSHQKILCCAHTVSDQQSRVRPLTPGDVYAAPPPLTLPVPQREEPQGPWQQRIALLPIPLEKALIASYRGVSRTLARQMMHQAGLYGNPNITEVSDQRWANLYQAWQHWLTAVASNHYQPGWTPEGYTVLGWNISQPAPNLQELLDPYYSDSLADQTLQQQRNQLSQALGAALKKVRVKLKDFEQRRDQAGDFEVLKEKADLLMAMGQKGRPGQSQLILPSFTTNEPITITLDPAKDPIANAQTYYKKHRKAHRALAALAPLIAAEVAERDYLEQVLAQVDQADLSVMSEIEQEIRQLGYLKPAPVRNLPEPAPYHRFTSPQGFTILCGRNNRQNEEITFRVAQPQDLWFHAQEIPGSHVLLQIPAGQTAEDADLEASANVAAHFSRARQSSIVPVLYTPRAQVRKLKGHLPGLVTYNHFQVLWGRPDQLPPRPVEVS